jgi:hypothetical protein
LRRRPAPPWYCSLGGRLSNTDGRGPCWPRAVTASKQGIAMLSVLIGVLITCVVGAICFWAIEKFVRDSRLANLLKLLVVLICVASILQRVLPLAGINWF